MSIKTIILFIVKHLCKEGLLWSVNINVTGCPVNAIWRIRHVAGVDYPSHYLNKY